jgi:hypothetical protein
MSYSAVKSPMQSNSKKSRSRTERPEDSFVMYSSSSDEITQVELESLNIEQSRHVNKEHLDAMGGIDMLCQRLGLDVNIGLTT